jgi:anti-anti-sigma factor
MVSFSEQIVHVTAEQGVTIIGFSRDEHGQSNVDLVRRYFSTQFLTATASMERLVIDLSGVLSLDSASLGPLVQKLRDLQAVKGRMALCGVQAPALREIFALTRFDKVFPIFKGRAEAVASLVVP